MYIKTYNAYYDQKDGWWIPIRNKGLIFHIDNTGKDEFIGLLPKGSKQTSRDICKTITYNDKVFFFSRCAYEVWVYDKKIKSFEYYKYLDANVELISCVDIIGNKAWVIPNVYSGTIVSIDLDNMNNVEALNLEKNIEAPVTRTAVSGSKIYFISRNMNDICLFAFDTTTKTIRSHKIDDAKFVNCITAADDSVWYIYKDKKNNAMLGNINNSFQGEKSIKLDNIKLPDTMAIDYYRMISIKGLLFAFSSIRGEVISIDPNTGSVNKFFEETIDENLSEPGAPLLNDIQVVDDLVFEFSPVLGFLYTFSPITNMWDKVKSDIAKTTYDLGIMEIMEHEEMVFESKDNTLDVFISAIAN